MAAHNELGIKGEQLAQDYLIKSGHQVLEKNWRHKHLEIDLISTHKNILIFTEVKTRSSDFFLKPEENVTLKKQNQLVKAADIYIGLLEKKLVEHKNFAIRFDIVAITIKSDGHKINWIKDAFYPLV